MLDLVPITTVDDHAVEVLLDRAFGADRHGRTAYRLREGTRAIPALSLAALEDDVLVGSIQCWPVAFNGDDGERIPITLVGPVAVEPGRQGDGIGRALFGAMLAAAREQGHDAAMMLIGDAEYYGRLFGFTAERTGAWRLPGPVERHRLLALGRSVPARAGTIAPRVDG